MQKIVILGTGGNCIDILDTILDINSAAGKELLRCIGFLDDDPEKRGTTIHGVPVFGSLSEASSIQDAMFVNGIGSTRNFWCKPDIVAKTGLASDRFKTIIHPTASVSRLATIGAGSVVLQKSVIASNARIGNHVMILPLSVVSHDAVVGDYTTIAGGVCLSGKVNVGRCCYIGSNCTVRENLNVGDNVLLGMGTVVISDVMSNTVMAGNPARKIRDLIPG